MSIETPVIFTGVVVVAGRWSSGQTIDFKVGVGFGAYALLISGLAAWNEKLATGFAALTLLSAFFVYLPALVQKLGLGSAAGGP